MLRDLYCNHKRFFFTTNGMRAMGSNKQSRAGPRSKRRGHRRNLTVLGPSQRRLSCSSTVCTLVGIERVCKGPFDATGLHGPPHCPLSSVDAITEAAALFLRPRLSTASTLVSFHVEQLTSTSMDLAALLLQLPLGSISHGPE